MNRFIKFSILCVLSVSSAFSSALENSETGFEQQIRIAINRQKEKVPFDAPLNIEEGWQSFFNQSVLRVRKKIEEKGALNIEFKDELDTMLNLVQEKASALFLEGEMDTYWYFFLHQLMGEVLSSDQEYDSNISILISDHDVESLNRREDISLDRLTYRTSAHFAHLVSCFNKIHFLRKNHLNSVREYLSDMRANHIYPFSDYRVDGESFSNKLLAGSSVLTKDCFYLPYVGAPSEIIFSVPVLNEAIVHRICSIGIPTHATTFDGSPLSSASAFAYHDLGHGDLFGALPGFQTHYFNPETDPLLRAIYPLHQKIAQEDNTSKRGLLQAGFFRGIHERDYALMIYPLNHTLDINHIVEQLSTEPASIDSEWLYPMNSKLEYYQGYVRDNYGIDVLKVIEEPRNKYTTKYHMLELTPDTVETAKEIHLGADYYNEELGVFLTTLSYDAQKSSIYEHYEMLISLGVDLPLSLKRKDGSYFERRTLPSNRVIDYFQDTIYPLLFEFQQRLLSDN